VSAYVKPETFTGDWRNHGKGRVMKCPTCGYQLRASIAITYAQCPRGHRMAVLTNNVPPHRPSRRGSAVVEELRAGTLVHAHAGPRLHGAMGQPSPEPDSLKNGYLEAA